MVAPGNPIAFPPSMAVVPEGVHIRDDELLYFEIRSKLEFIPDISGVKPGKTG